MAIQSTGDKILVVGETPETFHHLHHLLSEQGYHVSATLAITSLSETIWEQNPDLILLGNHGINPYEICQKLLEDELINKAPIIFLDSDNQVLNKHKVFQVGGADYLTYPWQTEDILSRVQHQLSRHQHQQPVPTEKQREAAPTVETFNLYLHTVSHDLKNPILGLSLVLQNLLKSTGASLNRESIEPQPANPMVSVPVTILEQMQKSCDRQLRLINSLIEVQQLALEGLCLDCQPLSLYPFTQTFIADWQPTLQENQAILQNQIPRDLPLVDADADQLWRVLENLVANAIKHNPPGVEIILNATKVEASVVPSTSTKLSSMICYTVSDDGLGIAPELTDVMFERYRRGKKAKRILGLGLGLYLCRQIIQAHGGDIGVKSEPGIGTEFWFTLKIASESDRKVHSNC